MSPTRSRSLAPLLVVPLLLGSGLLAGCGVSSDDTSQRRVHASTTPQASASDSATSTPTDSVDPDPVADAQPRRPSTSSSPTLTPEAALLTATEMPSLNDTVRWKQGSTGPVSSQQFGLCAKFDVLSIGAEQAVQRTFAAGSQGTAGSDSAAQQIATFPDAATTARATKVLQAWHDLRAARARDAR